MIEKGADSRHTLGNRSFARMVCVAGLSLSVALVASSVVDISHAWAEECPVCPRSRRNCNSLRLMFSTRQTSCRRRSALQVMLHRLKSRWTTSPIRLHAETPPMPCSTCRLNWMLSLLARVLTPPMSQGMSMRRKGLMLRSAVEPKVRSMPPRLLVCLRARPIVRTFLTKTIPSLKRKARKR